MNRWLIAVLVCVACETSEPPAQTPPAPQAPAAPQAPPAPPAPPALLHGAWSADGQNFSWLIEPDSILFEIDMQRHPYTIAGDTLLIDRGDPTIGIQKTRIIRVTADTLVIEDVMSGTREALLRLR